MFGNERVVLRSPRGNQFSRTTDDGFLWRDSTPEDVKRKRQAQYAEELKQQIVQKQHAQTLQPSSFDSSQYSRTQPPARAFMAAVSNLYGDRTAELERKRRQQEMFAESLRRQIEEKRRAKEAQQQMENSRELSYAAVANQASQMLENIRSGRSNANNPNNLSQTQPRPQQFKRSQFASNNQSNNDSNLNDLQPTLRFAQPPTVLNRTQPVARQKPERKVEPSFAETAPVNFARFHIDVSTESPFSHSKVETPPLGFSLRRSHPAASSMAISAPLRNDYQTLNGVQNINGQRNPTSLAQHPLRQSQPARFLNRGAFAKKNVQPDEQMRLGTASELVYPDGHVSPVSSPRL
ncbi:hypothetical protein TRFO_06303 [Tritrichomonas foetus]|uniref:Uncharacterized protein n=1 Tax=Tritrichomonas foetus TaxID=1144522 RepID=A0A1J4K4J4_9EUKA|nr:hypothetical protein TRFO_06303 [Tritrichomonas foetus]|eukprot:OHT04421.1 hypothetical protein TRFO_06303 [Tritrichomonas foetus]